MSVLATLTEESRSTLSLAAVPATSENSFSDSLTQLLDRVGCRRADSEEEKVKQPLLGMRMG